MNKLILFLISNFVILSAYSDICRDSFKIAIATVETNNNPAKIGKSGERSKYQFMRKTWNEYSKYPFYRVNKSNRAQLEAEKVMDLHISRLIHYCNTLGLEPTTYNMALLHNAGYGVVRRKKTLKRHYDYAERVNNLYHTNAPQKRYYVSFNYNQGK